ncbi:hypothetical protein CVIRNUC_009693 [Coccomyxa viridis]|uniref:Uncharacterized protein n=1 Tax=Coccomyxa viridis TaxID=1274662 RepID=A0AAV1IJU4_9CHLO|nr:hypothetical protein CVIRNUC_009693 [Coccomyxa viridis]
MGLSMMGHQRPQSTASSTRLRRKRRQNLRSRAAGQSMAAPCVIPVAAETSEGLTDKSMREGIPSSPFAVRSGTFPAFIIIKLTCLTQSSSNGLAFLFSC